MTVTALWSTRDWAEAIASVARPVKDLAKNGPLAGEHGPGKKGGPSTMPKKPSKELLDPEAQAITTPGGVSARGRAQPGLLGPTEESQARGDDSS